jgi:MiaB/RimO family radical SAM methylthiotransferase
MNAYVDCIGCEQRQLDAQRVIDYLKANKIALVDNPAQSDYSILVTCAVDRTSEDVSVARMKNLASRMGAESKLIIGGCLPSISPDRVRYDVYATFSPRDMETLDDIFKGDVRMAEVADPNKSMFDSSYEGVERELSPREEYDQAKFGYKIVIDQGCLLSCTFCKIKDATGRLQSVPLDSIVTQFQKAVDQGEQTIMLMGGDTGAYGYDIGTRFHNLLEEVLKIPGDYKVFIHDFNVNWLIRDEKGYRQAFESDIVNQHLRGINFPIQSGSDKILKLMKRPHKATDAINSLRRIKQDYPYINVGTHLIVGFPGESEEDFEATFKLLEEVDFDFVSCFPYSEHETARSAKLSDKVDSETIDERLNVIAKFLGDRVKIIR